MQHKKTSGGPPRSLGRMIRMISRCGKVYINQKIRSFDLGFPQFFILHALYHHPDASQEDIVRITGGDPSTTARTITRLIEKGYIRRQRNPQNRRAYCIRVTAKGQTLRQQFQQILNEYTEILCRNFSDIQKQEAYDLLERMQQNILSAIRQSQNEKDRQ